MMEQSPHWVARNLETEMRARMLFKKETKRTVVYESLALPIDQVYVQKAWIMAQPNYKPGRWPAEIELEVTVPEQGV